MKAKELMIGDWVYSKSDNKNHKVNSIISQNDGSVLIAIEKDVSPDYMFEPIPLKRIHLTKNGFNATNAEDTEFVYRDGYEIKVMIEEDLADAIFLSIEFAERNIWMEIKYVHELQQAMRLMGCEQEIRL
jgi:hypothetical protein